MTRFVTTLIVIVGGGLFALCSNAAALPFNDDMFDIDKRTGSIVRPRPLGSVPMGSLEYRVEPGEVEQLVNPLSGNELSAKRGNRLYMINCLPCHGDISKNPRQPGPVGVKLDEYLYGMGVPDLGGVDEKRNIDHKAKTDGYFFGAIRFGWGRMPAYGWKLSTTEHWDIVNYIRAVQKTR